MEVLKQLPPNSIDSIVTDPPYEQGLMGKAWDSTGISYNVELWKECLRVLKPGGYLLSFGGSRTYHRMACAIEDAGFEIRDQIMWIYGSGFPKSQNISKMIDKKTGAEREVIGKSNSKGIKSGQDNMVGDNYECNGYDITTPSTEEAKQWDGWGTALKPAHEDIVMARKPLSEKTVVQNVLKWGTGGINIDGGRVELNGDYKSKSNGRPSLTGLGDNYNPEEANKPDTLGRFPANIIFDEEAGKILDEQSGFNKSTASIRKNNSGMGNIQKDTTTTFGKGDVFGGFNDSGGASRFFYCAKSSKRERGEGNTHPTVKPIALMEYLIKLVTPPNCIVLDPFAGSGSTLQAAKNIGCFFIGIEKDENYCAIANKRIAEAREGLN